MEHFLDLQGNYSVVFSKGSVGELFSELPADEPDFILIDEHLGLESGINAIQAIKKSFPGAHLIIITGDDDPRLIMKALENGASGYLNKPFTLSQMVEAFSAVIVNGSFLQPSVTTRLIEVINKKKPGASALISKLTKKETEIAGLVVKGLSYKEIARQLDVTFFTVNHHVKNIYIKFDVNSVAQFIHKWHSEHDKL